MNFLFRPCFESSVTTLGRPKVSSPWMFVCSPSKIWCSIFELTPLYSSWLTDCKWRWFRLFLHLIRLYKSVMISQHSLQDGKLSHKKITIYSIIDFSSLWISSDWSGRSQWHISDVKTFFSFWMTLVLTVTTLVLPYCKIQFISCIMFENCFTVSNFFTSRYRFGGEGGLSRIHRHQTCKSSSDYGSTNKLQRPYRLQVFQLEPYY